MKTNNYLLPSLLAGFAVGVISFVPGIKNLSCCFLVPVAAFFAVYLYRRSTNTDYTEFKEAVIIGLLTGIISAFFSTGFEILSTFIARTNDFVKTLPQVEATLRNWDMGSFYENSFELLRRISREIRETGFSLLYSVFLLLTNLIVNPVFALLGAVTAKVFFNWRAEKK
jgi:Na+-driven multidrug efflux pump